MILNTVKQLEALCPYCAFPVSKDEWNRKEDTCKSVKNALYILQYAKTHFGPK